MTDVINTLGADTSAGEGADGVLHERSRTGLSADALRRAVSDHLLYSIARPASTLTSDHYYRALALAVRDRMQQRWMATTQDWLDSPAKVTCYLSADGCRSCRADPRRHQRRCTSDSRGSFGGMV